MPGGGKEKTMNVFPQGAFQKPREFCLGGGRGKKTLARSKNWHTDVEEGPKRMQKREKGAKSTTTAPALKKREADKA